GAANGWAKIVISISTISAAGGAADGILGCYEWATGDITLIQGWDWYTGADASAVGAGQYDFQTIVTHELGHSLGLGHSADGASPMHGTLAAGAAHRTLTTADLGIHDGDGGGADPLHAAAVPPG